MHFPISSSFRLNSSVSVAALLGDVVPPVVGDLTRAELVDLPNTAGRTSAATLKVPGSDTLPAGASLAGTTITVTGDNVSLAGWDLNGFKVVQSGNNLTISESNTGGNLGGFWLAQSVGVSGLTVQRSEIEPYTRVGSNAWIEVTADNTVIEDCLLFGHPTDIIKSRGQDGFVIRRCALGRPKNYSLATTYSAVEIYDTGQVVTDGAGGYWYSNTDNNVGNALPAAGSDNASWTGYSGSGAPHFDQINPSGAAGDMLVENCYFDVDRDASADTHTNNVLRIGGGAAVTVGQITFRNNYIDKGASIGAGRPFELSGTLTVESDAILSWQDNYLSYGNNDSMVSGIGPDDFYGKAFWSGNVDNDNGDAAIGIPSAAWFDGAPGDVVPAIPTPPTSEVVSVITGPTVPGTATQMTLEMNVRVEHVQGQADIFNNQGGTAQRIELRGGSDNDTFNSTFRSNESGVVVSGGSPQNAIFRNIWTVMRFELDLEAGTYRIYRNDALVHDDTTDVDTSADTIIGQTWEFFSEASRLIDGSSESQVGWINMWWGTAGAGVGVSGAAPTRTPDYEYVGGASSTAIFTPSATVPNFITPNTDAVGTYVAGPPVRLSIPANAGDPFLEAFDAGFADASDAEMLVKFAATSNAREVGALVYWGAFDDTTSNFTGLVAILVQPDNSSAEMSLEVYEYTDGVKGAALLDEDAGFILANSVTNAAILRADLTGTALSVSAWEDGTTEPATWQHTVTVTNPTGDKCGLGNYSQRAATLYGGSQGVGTSAPAV